MILTKTEVWESFTAQGSTYSSFNFFFPFQLYWQNNTFWRSFFFLISLIFSLEIFPLFVLLKILLSKWIYRKNWLFVWIWRHESIHVTIRTIKDTKSGQKNSSLPLKNSPVLSICRHTLPQPQSLATTDLLSITKVLFFPGSYINGIIQYIIFWDWRLLLGIMSLRFIQVVAYIHSPFLFIAEQNSIVWM